MKDVFFFQTPHTSVGCNAEETGTGIRGQGGPTYQGVNAPEEEHGHTGANQEVGRRANCCRATTSQETRGKVCWLETRAMSHAMRTMKRRNAYPLQR